MVVLFIVIVYLVIFFIDLLPNMKNHASKAFKVLYIAAFSFSMIVLIMQTIGISFL